MQLIFFGSDQYSTVALNTILSNLPGDSRKVSVVTDKHEGGSPVDQLALKHKLPVSYYPTLPTITKDTIGLCASFDHLIPPAIIQKFAGNLYNLHPSLLPQYRNVSPVQYALALGDKMTGITLFRISPGIDDGEIIAQASEPILASDTTATLTPRLFKKGAELFLQRTVLCKPDLPNKEPFFVNPDTPLIFTKRLKKDSGYIEWDVLHALLKNQPPKTTSHNILLNLQPTKSLDHLLRALTPWPGIWSLVPSTKGDLRISLESVKPDITLKIAGKPKAITLKDFEKYYL